MSETIFSKLERKPADGGKAVTFDGGEECILLLGERALTKRGTHTEQQIHEHRTDEKLIKDSHAVSRCRAVV